MLEMLEPYGLLLLVQLLLRVLLARQLLLLQGLLEVQLLAHLFSHVRLLPLLLVHLKLKLHLPLLFLLLREPFGFFFLLFDLTHDV